MTVLFVGASRPSNGAPTSIMCVASCPIMYDMSCVSVFARKLAHGLVVKMFAHKDCKLRGYVLVLSHRYFEMMDTMQHQTGVSALLIGSLRATGRTTTQYLASGPLRLEMTGSRSSQIRQQNKPDKYLNNLSKINIWVLDRLHHALEQRDPQVAHVCLHLMMMNHQFRSTRTSRPQQTKHPSSFCIAHGAPVTTVLLAHSTILQHFTFSPPHENRSS